ncbi:hypothetical protein TTHERM_00371040 (macronuclear) [Tetrahymena thermophila SB210]|uniref:Uncharacterized protein n=1 Tax=Tetrahymena thermophila (strain SB210) TaxID=312017 RepID=I7M0K5_TETTS|nr:hypothetical protein TTHERM_00371040 [Tetrahymena thermophila SB210]EAR89289.2 hypothetical protein TTHERM_00371040 [Tetrahymena thermophila SB210]|eukprot:XP_001009534.2 hypothetical protein TTHERM_00371040 [Tetrahymena thermophila SB210]
MNYRTISTPNTAYTIKTPQYYHKTGQKGKEKSLHEIKFNADQYSILGERTLEILKKRERSGVERDEVEKECLEVLMTLDVENGLQANHYEDQVMLEKALQKITQMARDNKNLKELKDLLSILVNQRKQLKEREDAFLNSLSVFIDFYARGDFELLQKGIIRDAFLQKELEQLHKLMALKQKLINDRKKFHFDLNSFLQQPAKPPTPIPIEYEPVVEKVVTPPPPPPKREPERPQCNLWNFEHPSLRDWRANFLGPQFPYHTFTIEQLLLLLGQRQQPSIQVLPPLNQPGPTNIYMGGAMPPFQAPFNLKMEWPYVTGLSHRFPRGANTEVEQLEYLKAMEADLLLNLRKTPPFSPEYGILASHLNLIRQLIGNYDKKKYHWLDYSHEIVNLPGTTIKPTKLIHYQVPFEDPSGAVNNLSTSINNASLGQKRVGSSPNITIERSGTPNKAQNLTNTQIIPGQQFPPGNHTQKITQKYRMKINVNDIEGISGFRFKFHKLEKLAEKHGNSFTVRGALLYGDDVYIDKNGDNCSFSAIINGVRSETDPSKVLGKAKRDFDIDMRPVLSEFHTIEDLEKFKLLLNVFDKDGKLIGWEVFPMYTNLRFNKGRYTCCLYAPPSQKPPFSDPKIPLDIEMQHEIIPLPCPDSDDDSDDEYMHVYGRNKRFINSTTSQILDGFDDPAQRIKLEDDNINEIDRLRKYKLALLRKKGDGMFEDDQDNLDKYKMQTKKNQLDSNRNQKKRGEGEGDDDDDEYRKNKQERAKNNKLNLSDYDNIHGFRLKFNTLKNYDIKKGKKVTVRLAIVYGQTVIKDLNGLQCADSKDMVAKQSKQDITAVDINFIRDFDVDLYDLVQQYDYNELEKFCLIANFFDEAGNQVGWITIPLFKYRKFNKGKKVDYLYEPPALPPPFEGQKTNSKFKIESEMIPFPIDKDIDISVDQVQSLNLSSIKRAPQQNKRGDSPRNAGVMRNNLVSPKNNNILNSSLNNSLNSNNQINDLNNNLSKKNDQNNNNNNPSSVRSNNLNSNNNPNNQKNNLNNSSLKNSNLPKKVPIPNIKPSDKSILIRFLNLKNHDPSKGNQLTIRGSMIFGEEVMMDDLGNSCTYNKSFNAQAGAERNSLQLQQECIYNLNPNKLQDDYDIKQLESMQMYYTVYDNKQNQIGWIVFPLFKYKKLNKGKFTNYLLEPPSQQPPFNLQAIKNSKSRLEYEIMTSEYQSVNQEEEDEQSPQIINSNNKNINNNLSNNYDEDDDNNNNKNKQKNNKNSNKNAAAQQSQDFSDLDSEPDSKIGVSIYLKEVKNQKEKISIAYHLKICDTIITKLILSRDSQPCYFETDSVFDPDTKLKNNLIDEKVFFLIDPDKLKSKTHNFQNVFLSIFFLKENPQKIEDGESPYGWFAQPLYDAKGNFKKGTFSEKIFKLPEQQSFPLNTKSLSKLDSQIEFTIDVVNAPQK